nr:hypothetical protein CFP56_60649 [Quercus suber]
MMGNPSTRRYVYLSLFGHHLCAVHDHEHHGRQHHVFSGRNMKNLLKSMHNLHGREAKHHLTIRVAITHFDSCSLNRQSASDTGFEISSWYFVARRFVQETILFSRITRDDKVKD